MYELKGLPGNQGGLLVCLFELVLDRGDGASFDDASCTAAAKDLLCK